MAINDGYTSTTMSRFKNQTATSASGGISYFEWMIHVDIIIAISFVLYWVPYNITGKINKVTFIFQKLYLDNKHDIYCMHTKKRFWASIFNIDVSQAL